MSSGLTLPAVLTWLSSGPCTATANGDTDLWIRHKTSANGWRTSLSVYYAGEASSADVVLTRYDDSGKPVGPAVTITAFTALRWLSSQ